MDCLNWIECHPGAAAWVQGGGTLIAVAIAVWLAHRQEQQAARTRSNDEKQAAKDRQTLQQALAAMIYGELLSAGQKLSAVREAYVPFEGRRTCSWFVKTGDQLEISEHETMTRLWPMLISLEPELFASISSIISQIGFFNSLLQKIRVQATAAGNANIPLGADLASIELPEDTKQLADFADAILGEMDKMAPKLKALHPHAERFSKDLFATRAEQMATEN